MKRIFLETERLILRDPKMSDLEAHHALLSNEKVMRFLPDIKTTTKKESEDNLRKAIAAVQETPRQFYFLVMEEKETGTYVGQVGYTVAAETLLGKLVHMGYFIQEMFWGKGYMTEAVKCLLAFAFLEDDVIRVSTGCLKENIASARVMEKCGMIKEADRKKFSWHEEALKDRLEYRLLKEEWEKI